MEKVADRVEYIRKEKGLSYAKMAEVIDNGITGEGLRKAIQRNSIKRIYIKTFCNKFGINRNWLEFGEGQMMENVESSQDKPFTQDEGVLQILITAKNTGKITPNQVNIILKQIEVYQEVQKDYVNLLKELASLRGKTI